MLNGRRSNTASAIQELKIVARLVHENQEIQTIEKVLGVVNAESEKEASIPTKGIDETATEFLNEIQNAASENGYTITNDVLNETAISLILCIFKPEPQTTI